MAKKITMWEVAEIIGVTDPAMETVAGAAGNGRLFGVGGSALKPSPVTSGCVPVAWVEEVLRLYREQYFDLNMRHFHEKLKENTAPS